MAQIRIRKIDDNLMKLLEDRAQLKGRSVEDEVREILRDALKDEPEEREPSLRGENLTVRVIFGIFKTHDRLSRYPSTQLFFRSFCGADAADFFETLS